MKIQNNVAENIVNTPYQRKNDEGNNEIFTNISKITVKDTAPSIKTNLSSSVSIEVGSSKTISFTAGGTNNKYTWYLSNSATLKGTVYKTTSKPEITISPTNFDLTELIIFKNELYCIRISLLTISLNSSIL